MRRDLRAMLVAVGWAGLAVACHAQSAGPQNQNQNPAPCTVAPQPVPCVAASAPSASQSNSPASNADRFPFPGENSGAPTPPIPSLPAPSSNSRPPQGPGAGGSGAAFPFPDETPAAGGSSSSSSSSSSSDDANPDASPNAAPGGLQDRGSEGSNAPEGRHLLHRVNPIGTKLQSADEREAEDLDVAHFYAQTGDLKGAYTRSLDAVKIAPDDPDAHFALAEAALKLGKRDEAIAEYDACLKLDPVDKEAKAARKELAKLKP